jgi:hypothetical protein
MEAALKKAIIQLRQMATPQTMTTTMPPTFQTKDKKIPDLLLTFIERTLKNNFEEKEEATSTMGLTEKTRTDVFHRTKRKNTKLLLLIISFFKFIKFNCSILYYTWQSNSMRKILNNFHNQSQQS